MSRENTQTLVGKKGKRFKRGNKTYTVRGNDAISDCGEDIIDLLTQFYLVDMLLDSADASVDLGVTNESYDADCSVVDEPRSYDLDVSSSSYSSSDSGSSDCGSSDCGCD